MSTLVAAPETLHQAAEKLLKALNEIISKGFSQAKLNEHDVQILTTSYDLLKQRITDLEGQLEAYRHPVNPPPGVTTPAVVDSFGDGLKRQSNNSYNRRCSNPHCKNWIHEHNSTGLCPDCFFRANPSLYVTD